MQHFERGRLHGHNIVAVLPGSAPEQQAGHVVIGAHYDHLGHGQTGSLALFGEKGEIHNGADDNASGSAALLEIAEAFATLEPRPERSVVFVWFDAEEQGLIGSQYYVEHPRFPLRRCAAMFNLDMVGRARDGRVAVLGATSGEGLERIVLGAARRNRLDATLVPYMVPNSDHFSFYRKKVPVAFFTTGLHADYHRPSDDADRIDMQTLVRIARCAFDAARTVAATAGPRPAWHEVRSAPFGFMALELLEGLTGREGFGKLARALYGPVAGAVVLPSEHGLEVLYVEPDSALAEAGVRAGDRLEAARGGLLGSRRHALGGRLGRLRLWAALTGPPATLELRRGDRSLSIPFPPRHDAR
ncbi:MAG: M20/M25/M40 family metallo-hydrolase [Planctomycetota bacterium]|nr:MAG: M20/M25/M40 family metallo-hydrolase [Planctomycetota bacterium]